MYILLLLWNCKCVEGLALDDNELKIQALWVPEFQFALGEKGRLKTCQLLFPCPEFIVLSVCYKTCPRMSVAIFIYF